MTEKPKGRQGLASMSQERRRAIAAMGGSQKNKNGRGKFWTSESARAASRKYWDSRAAAAGK